MENSYLVLEPSWCSVPRKVAEVAQPVPGMTGGYGERPAEDDQLSDTGLTVKDCSTGPFAGSSPALGTTIQTCRSVTKIS